MPETRPDDEITALNGSEETPTVEADAAVSPPETPTDPLAELAPNVTIVGDGNVVGDDNVVVVAKDGGTVNLNLRVEATEAFIKWYELRGRSGEEIVEQLLRLAITGRDNPAIPQPHRDRAAEACLKIKGRTLAEIRVDKELLAVLGLLLVGDFARDVIAALRRKREEPIVPSTLPTPEPEPRSQLNRRPKLTNRRNFEPELVFVPAGNFLMGSDKYDKHAYDNEKPQHTVYLPNYYITKVPVTNAQYRVFVQDTGHRAPDHWEYGWIPFTKENHPVCHVWWSDVVAYCEWLTDVTGKSYRLPTEAEWEKAARDGDGWIYPWGNVWHSARCNTHESGINDTTPVGRYSPQGDSPYGCVDMAGNVWEWTSSLWGNGWGKPDYKYPYRFDDGREDMGSSALRVLRGGSFKSKRGKVRCAYRYWDAVHRHYSDVGFRVVMSSSRA